MKCLLAVSPQRLYRAGLAVLLCLPLLAQADVFSLMRKVTMDRLEFEIVVTDDSDRPLPGALLWYIDNPVERETGLRLDVADAQRMAGRYFRQGDFLDTGDIPGAVFRRTDLDGRYRNFRETRYPDGRYPYLLVATKRGYLPAVAAGVAPLNEHYLVKFRLKRDPEWPVAARMEEFDRLLAQSLSPIPGEDLTGEARMQRLDALRRQTETLAAALEKDGKADEASAIYWTLARFPQVIRLQQANGSYQIVGYRHGGSDKESAALRLRATQLNRSIPKLTLPQELLARGFQRTGIYTADHGLAYLAAFERIAGGKSADQLLPREYRVAVHQAIMWSTADAACDLLQRAYRFEPTAITPKDGWEMLAEIKTRRAQQNLPPQECTVAGLAPFAEPVRRR